MRRKSKNEKVAEDIVRSLRFANSREFKNISDDSLKGIILSVLKLWYKPVRKKEIDNSWKGFEWINCDDSENSTLSFVRKSRNSDEFLIFVCNFTPVPRLGYRLGVPKKGIYHEVLNSDSENYGGSNIRNLGQVYAQNIPSHGKPYSVDLNLPPLGCVVLKPIS